MSKDEISIQLCNVIDDRFNFVIEIADCKQFVLYTIVKIMTIHETTFNENNKSMLKLIKILQYENTFIQR